MTPSTIDDARLVRHVAALYRLGRTDPGGGVRPETIAEDTGFSAGTITTHLSNLADAGRVGTVWGFNPETMKPRRSFVPADTENEHAPGAFTDSESGGARP